MVRGGGGTSARFLPPAGNASISTVTPLLVAMLGAGSASTGRESLCNNDGAADAAPLPHANPLSSGERGLNALADAQRMANETEQLGATIMGQLGQQRSQLNDAIDRRQFGRSSDLDRPDPVQPLEAFLVLLERALQRKNSDGDLCCIIHIFMYSQLVLAGLSGRRAVGCCAGSLVRAGSKKMNDGAAERTMERRPADSLD